MFQNARKFIVFQFTVSAAMLVTCFVSAITLGNLPFNVVQMLWLNLVMDILAAIALGTGCDSTRKGRVSRSERVFGPGMWRQIVVQAAYQILVLLLLVYLAGMMLGQEYFLLTVNPRDKGKMEADTFIFHTFFWMTMFNQINSRVVDENEANVFKTLLSNWIFWAVWLLEVLLEHVMLVWASTSATGSAILGMTALPPEVLLISVAIGALSLGIHALHVKYIPLTHFEKLDKMIGLDLPQGNAAGKIDNLFSKIKNRVGNTNADDDDDDAYHRMPNGESPSPAKSLDGPYEPGDKNMY